MGTLRNLASFRLQKHLDRCGRVRRQRSRQATTPPPVFSSFPLPQLEEQDESSSMEHLQIGMTSEVWEDPPSSPYTPPLMDSNTNHNNHNHPFIQRQTQTHDDRRENSFFMTQEGQTDPQQVDHPPNHSFPVSDQSYRGEGEGEGGRLRDTISTLEYAKTKTNYNAIFTCT